MSEAPPGPQEQDRYPYSAIVDRKPLRWPNGARVAVWVIPNIEHFLFDRPSTSVTAVTASLVPDVLNSSRAASSWDGNGWATVTTIPR